MNEFFLQHRNILQRDFHTHVSPGHHNAAAAADDLGAVLHAVCAFNFRHDADGCVIVFIQNLSDLHHIVRTPDKRCGNDIKSVFDAKHNIFFIFFA